MMHKRPARCAAFCLLAAWPGIAEAHGAIPGIGTFYSSMLHPLLVPAHALVFVGISLALSQHGRAIARIGISALTVAFICALASTLFIVLPAPSQESLLIMAAVVGTIVAVAKPLPWRVLVVVALAAGLSLGLDSKPDTITARDTFLACLGLCLGAFVLLILVVGITLNADQKWQQIGIRIVGSWTVAASVLVLALLLNNKS
jgi:urease accessory protein